MVLTLFVLFKKGSLMEKKAQIYTLPEGHSNSSLAGRIPVFLTSEDAADFLKTLNNEWDAMILDPGLRNECQPRKLKPIVVGQSGKGCWAFIDAVWDL